jgi:hypothetical protein
MLRCVTRRVFKSPLLRTRKGARLLGHTCTLSYTLKTLICNVTPGYHAEKNADLTQLVINTARD